MCLLQAPCLIICYFYLYMLRLLKCSLYNAVRSDFERRSGTGRLLVVGQFAFSVTSPSVSLVPMEQNYNRVIVPKHKRSIERLCFGFVRGMTTRTGWTTSDVCIAFPSSTPSTCKKASGATLRIMLYPPFTSALMNRASDAR